MMAWSQFHHYVEKFMSPLVIATAWSIVSFRSQRLFALIFVLSHGLAFLLAGGYGVDLNIFFNAYAATVIVCGLALSDIASKLLVSQTSALNSSAAMMFGLFFISIMIFVPGQFRQDRRQIKELPAHEMEFNSAVDFLKTHPGPAACESLLLCYESGKSFEYEPFSVRGLLKTGWLHEGDVLQLLKTHHFQVVQIALRSDEEYMNPAELQASLSADQKTVDKERRFTPNFMRELLQDYELSLRTSQMAIFSPK
jgi:hypothetical protein